MTKSLGLLTEAILERDQPRATDLALQSMRLFAEEVSPKLERRR